MTILSKQPNEANSTSPSITIAYLILVHRLPKQFKRMFKAVYHPDNVYLIHIDKKVTRPIQYDLTNFLKDFPNTYVLESEYILWGGYSMVKAELAGMAYLLNINANWDYFINLSGQDFPLKSQKIIKEFLVENKGTNYIKIANQELIRPETLNRIQNYYEETPQGVSITLQKRTFLKNVQPYIGGQWMILTRNCCTFICTSSEMQKFKDYYKNTHIADESFFQTILMNSSFEGSFIDDDKRAIIWIEDGDIKLRPKTFTKEDAAFIAASSCLFARKFDDNVDSTIIDELLSQFNTPLNDTVLQMSIPLSNTYSKLTATNGVLV